MKVFEKVAVFFRQASLVLFITLLLIGAMEMAAKAYLKAERAGKSIYMIDYTDETIRALYDTDDPEHYRAVLKEGWGTAIKIDYAPFVDFDIQPFEGRHVTIRAAGFRTTPDGPQTLDVEGRRVFVFGGSTTLGMGVGDRETLPEYLNQALGAGTTVFNFGRPGYYSTQERILFERLLAEGYVPDVAVFVDGLNDFYFCTTPDRSGFTPNIQRMVANSSNKTLGSLLLARSNVLRLAAYLGGQGELRPNADGATCKSEEDARAVIRRLDANRRMIKGIADAYGIEVVFVQQPVPTYAYDNAKRPVPLHDPEALGFHANSAIGYPLMADMRAQSQLFDDGVLWLEEAAIEDNMYVDLVHYSPRFNAHLAGRIAKSLK